MYEKIASDKQLISGFNSLSDNAKFEELLKETKRQLRSRLELQILNHKFKHLIVFTVIKPAYQSGVTHVVVLATLYEVVDDRRTTSEITEIVNS